MKNALRYLIAIAVLLGFLLIVAGFSYDVAFAGLPYQDPTPEMTLRFNHHKAVAHRIMYAGGLVFVVGIIAGIFSLLTARFFLRRSERLQ